jgi:hypothetical protein
MSRKALRTIDTREHTAASIGASSRDNDRSAIVIKIGAALRVINKSEAALNERLGFVLGAVVDPLDVVLLRPEIPSSMADTIVSAIETAERSRRRVTRCAKT